MVFHQHAKPDPATTKLAWGKAIEESRAHLRWGVIVDVLAASSGWIDTGVDLTLGEEVSLFSAGMVWLVKNLGVGLNGATALWYRIGPGPVAKSVGTTTSFRAEQDGRLHLIAKPPGEWRDPSGNFDPDCPHEGAEGGLSVAVLVWSGTAKEGLARMRAQDASGYAGREIGRLAERRTLPKGWQHLWRLGETRIFRVEAGGQQPARICCAAAQDAGILQYPVNVPLDQSTRLSWAWRADELPSRLREDSLSTHDYFSIAVEFENGRDLTYMWSAALPEGKVFACPLPWWNKRETHQVVRSDTAKLGIWLDEEQAILSDYERAIAGEPPKRIIAVWLIAVSVFQRRKGTCSFARIRFKTGMGEIFIGP
ncbi:MAG TPA: DUF3047 domain-containing protein [Methylocella sp.]|nr:DUF3047 domain-containing protein [Methylocella sp.]